MKKEFTPYFCEDNIVDVILPADRIKEDETKEWFIIGWPGVDGGDTETKETVYSILTYKIISKTWCIRKMSSVREIINNTVPNPSRQKINND